MFHITTALDIPMRHLFSGEPGRPSDEKEDRLEGLIEFLRGLNATDLELFNEILPRLVEWKGGREPGFLFDIGSMSNTVQLLTYHLIAARYYLLPTAAYRA